MRRILPKTVSLLAMRPLGSLLAFDAALSRALAACDPTRGTEEVPVARALGRVLAEDVRSAIDIPGTRRAAMDGYALPSGGPRPPGVSFRRVGFLPAGRTWPRKIPPGACLEIATGAAVPASCGAVIEFEETDRQGDRIAPRLPVERGRNVIPAGADLRRGSRLLRAGEVLTPGRLGGAAAVGRKALRVRRKPGVALLTTGDEIRPPGTRLAPHQVYDSNAAVLAGIVQAAGGEVRTSHRCPDDPAAIGRILDRLLSEGIDAVVFTGGSSVGNRDFTGDLLRARGRLLFRGIRVKPGRPTLVATAGPPGRRRLLVGMPGYPASCLLVGHALLAPVLRRMAGLPEPVPVAARLAREVRSQRGRTDFCPVRLAGSRAFPTFRGSHAVTSVAAADGFFTIPAGAEDFAKGQTVKIVLF